jgi:hypothetical protein
MLASIWVNPQRIRVFQFIRIHLIIAILLVRFDNIIQDVIVMKGQGNGKAKYCKINKEFVLLSKLKNKIIEI